MWDIRKNADKGAIYASVVSSLTGRAASFFEIIVSEKEADEEGLDPGVVGPAAAEMRLDKEVERYCQEDRRLSDVFNVVMRKIAVTLEDLRAFSDADTQNLATQLDLRRLEVHARAVGLPERTKDKSVKAAFRSSLTADVSLPALRAIIIELMAADPGFSLDRYLGDVDSNGKRRQATSYRVKDGMDGEVVDRDGANVLLRDGTMIGGPIRSQKVVDFLKKDAEILRTSEDIKTILATQARIERLGGALDGAQREELLGQWQLNPIIEKGPTGEAYKHAIQKLSGDSRKARLRSDLTNLISYSGYAGDKSFWEEDEAEWTTRINNYANEYMRALDDVGGHRERGGGDLGPELRSEVSNLLANLREEAEFCRGIRQKVLAKLSAEGKPPTERRVNKVLWEEYHSAARGGWVGNYWGLKSIFDGDIREAEKAIKAAEEERKNKRLKKAADDGKGVNIRHTAIRSPETALAKLRDYWTGLPEEAFRHLFLLAQGSPDTAKALGEFISASGMGDGGRLDDAFRIIGTRLLEGSWSRQFRGKILAYAHHKGREDLTSWDDLEIYSVVSIGRAVPEAHNGEAIQLICAEFDRGQRYGSPQVPVDEDLLAQLLDYYLGRVVDPGGGGIDPETLKSLLGASHTPAGEAIWKHLRGWGAGKASAGSNGGDEDGADSNIYQNLYLSMAAKYGGEGDQEVFTPGTDPVANTLGFALNYGRGNSDLAATFLRHMLRCMRGSTRYARSATELDLGKINTKVVNDVFEKMGIQDIGTGWLSSSININKLMDSPALNSDPLYAGILLEGALEGGFESPCGTASARAIIMTLGLPVERGEEVFAKFYGPASDELTAYRADNNILDVAKTVDEIIGKQKSGDRAPSYYGRSREYYLSTSNLRFFDALVRRNQGFAKLHNIERLPGDVVDTLSQETLIICSRIAKNIFENTTHAAHQHQLKNYLRIFAADEALSTEIIMGQPKITPKQAVICAKTLNGAAVKKCGVRLLALVKGNKEDIDAISPLLDPEQLGDEEVKLVSSTPAALAKRVGEGDRSLSTAEWKKLLRSVDALTGLLGDLASAGNVKLINQLWALAESFDIAVGEAGFDAARKTYREVLSTDDGEASFLALFGPVAGRLREFANFLVENPYRVLLNPSQVTGSNPYDIDFHKRLIKIMEDAGIEEEGARYQKHILDAAIRNCGTEGEGDGNLEGFVALVRAFGGEESVRAAYEEAAGEYLNALKNPQSTYYIKNAGSRLKRMKKIAVSVGLPSAVEGIADVDLVQSED